MSATSAAAGSSSSRWKSWGKTAFDKSYDLSDWAADKANGISYKFGGEAFWPKRGDFEEEIKKCEKILRAFTVEGLVQKEEKEEEITDAKGNKIKKKRKVLKKIPPRAIKNAKGIVIYTAMRSGIAPFGGAGGTGLVLARLPDGSWSAPASISPNNLSVGLLIGVDIFDVVLLLNSQKAVESFYTPAKMTLGAETAVVAGPVGAGTGMEAGVERAPIFSYVKSRGLYAGVELMGQAFLSRFDENERFYYWPGVKPRDVLTNNVRVPAAVLPLHRALRDAETGVAQGGKLERTVYDVVKVPNSEVFQQLSRSKPSRNSSNASGSQEGVEGGSDEEIVREGERLKLPPTPEELEALEAAGIPDEEDIRLEQKEREEVYKLPAPPMHRKVKTYWDQHPNKRAWRTTEQLFIGGPEAERRRQRMLLEPEEIPLPPSPMSPKSPGPGQVNGFSQKPAFFEVGGGDTSSSTADTSTESASPILPPPTRNLPPQGKHSSPGSKRKPPPKLVAPSARKEAPGAKHQIAIVGPNGAEVEAEEELETLPPVPLEDVDHSQSNGNGHVHAINGHAADEDDDDEEGEGQLLGQDLDEEEADNLLAREISASASDKSTGGAAAAADDDEVSQQEGQLASLTLDTDLTTDVDADATTPTPTAATLNADDAATAATAATAPPPMRPSRNRSRAPAT